MSSSGPENNHSVFPPPSKDLLLMRRMRRCSGLLYHKFQLNFSQNRILLILCRHGGTMPQKNLMDEMGIQAGSLSEILSKVEQSGFVEKNRLKDDKRNFEIILTEKGEMQARAFQVEREEMADFLFSCLNEDDKKHLDQILDKLLVHWENAESGRENSHP